MKIGILCGHPIKNLFGSTEEVDVETPFGSVSVLIGKSKGHDIFFINRHGKDAKLPPHQISYRANIQALSSSHVDCVISIGTVGSMNERIYPGDFIIPHDFFDATHTRIMSFFDDRRVHVDMTDPFCPALRNHLITSCSEIKDIVVHSQGVYVTTEGPRLESAAEIKFFATVGDVVGMTLVPEVVLAREKGLCFASLCVVCNMAAGLQEKLPVDDIKRIYTEKEAYVAEIIQNTIERISEEKDCLCMKKSEDAVL